MFILRSCNSELDEIKEKYENVGVDLRLRLNEFVAPPYLKDEIESCVAKLLPQSTTKTIKSIQLSKDVAERAEKHLEYIAHKYNCCVKTELTYKSRSYIIPRSSSSNKQMSKSLIDQSNDFCCSSDVFNKIPVGNGSIEIRIGDIAQQKVSLMIVFIISLLLL
jgi:hypothetical protein